MTSSMDEEDCGEFSACHSANKVETVRRAVIKRWSKLSKDRQNAEGGNFSGFS